MSELFEKIKNDSKKLRLARDPLAPASVHLISVIQGIAKTNNADVTDDMVISSVRSQIKKLNDTISLTEGKVDTSSVVSEREFISKYLPQEVSSDQIINILNEIFKDTDEKSIKDMGRVMKTLREQFGSSLNPSTASSVVKDYLNG